MNPNRGVVDLVISHCPIETVQQAQLVGKQLAEIQQPRNLTPLTQGGPANYPERLTTNIILGNDDGPFAVDVFERPTKETFTRV